MMLITGMLISGKMSVAIFSSTKGVASTISIAMTMKVYGRRRAIETMGMAEKGGWGKDALPLDGGSAQP